jgi:hypothetical protein
MSSTGRVPRGLVDGTDQPLRMNQATDALQGQYALRCRWCSPQPKIGGTRRSQGERGGA